MNKRSKNQIIQELGMKFINEPSEINFTKLMEYSKWGLKKFIYDIVKDVYSVEDVLSHTMEHVWFYHKSYNPECSSFCTWMYKIAYNDSLICINNRAKNEYVFVDKDINDYFNLYLTEDSDDHESFEGGYDTETGDIVLSGNKYSIYTKEGVMSDIYDASVECINKLPDTLKLIMYERYVNKKKVKQIAADNQFPISSVKNWIRKGEALLEEEVKLNYTELYNVYKSLSA